jgi:uncharacterized MAPEG superfamily protein
MTTPLLCVFAAFGLIWLARVPVVVALVRSPDGFDNKNPYRQLMRLGRRGGWQGRAVAAAQGVQQAFAPFAAAVVIAHLCGADPRRSGVLAIGFVLTQVLYVAAYIANIDYLRAFVWLIGLFCVIGLFALSV